MDKMQMIAEVLALGFNKIIVVLIIAILTQAVIYRIFGFSIYNFFNDLIAEEVPGMRKVGYWKKRKTTRYSTRSLQIEKYLVVR